MPDIARGGKPSHSSHDTAASSLARSSFDAGFFGMTVLVITVHEYKYPAFPEDKHFISGSGHFLNSQMLLKLPSAVWSTILWNITSTKIKNTLSMKIFDLDLP